jgi:YVTN family beta-propeller protein
LQQVFAYSQYTVFLGGYGSSGLAINPETDRVYVTNVESDTVSLFDISTQELAGTIVVGTQPTAIAVNPGTNTIYVANYLDSTITVIDGASNREVNVIELAEVDAGPNALVLIPSGNLYVSNELSDSITVIDTADNTVTDNIQLEEGSGPAGIVFNPANGLLYVAARNIGQLLLIDPSDGRFVETIPVGVYPLGVAVNAETNVAYVTNHESNSVSVIRDNKLVANVTVGSFPRGVAVNPETNAIYVSNEDSTTVSVIDGSSNEVVAEIVVGDAPQQLVVIPEDNALYVTSYLAGLLHIISDLQEQEPRAKPFSASAIHDGKTFRITGESETARITSFSIEPFTSVTLNIEGEGQITISIPTDLIDGIQSLKEVVSGEEIDFHQVRTSRTSTTISFDAQQGASSIEMIGVRVVPEFPGILAILVLAFPIAVFMVARRFFILTSK